MREFTFSVSLRANSLDDAETVMAERLDHEEDYGFDYEGLTWWLTDEWGEVK